MKKRALFLFFFSIRSLFSLTASWNVDADGAWGTGSNWSGGSSPNTAADTANFGSVITAPRNVSVDTGFATIGTMTVDNANAYTFPTTGGTLTFDNGGSDSALTITNTNGDGAHEISSNVVFGGTTNITISQGSSGTFTISGNITSGGVLTKTGSGTLSLTGTNAYTGGTTISSGTVAINNGSALGTAGTVSMADGTTLQLDSVSYTMSRPITFPTGGTVTFDAGDSGGPFTNISLNGGVSGTNSSLIKNGGTQVTVSPTTFTGTTTMTINGGYLRNATNGVSDITVNTPGGINFAGSLSVTATMTWNGFCNLRVESGTPSFSGAWTGSGTAYKQGAGNTSYIANSPSFSGTLTWREGTCIFQSGAVFDTGTFNLEVGAGRIDQTSITFGRLAGSSGTGLSLFNAAGTVLTLDQTLSSTYTGIISQVTTSSIVKTGTGSITFSGTNTFSGGVTLSAGTFGFASTGAAGTGGFTVDASGTTISLVNNAAPTNNISVSSAGSTTTSLSVPSGNSGTINGIISETGGGSAAMDKIDTGTLTLTAANSYTGGTTITAGTLALSGSGSLSSGGAVTANGTFDISGISASSLTIGLFSGSGTATITGKELIVTSTSNTEFSGVMQGASGSLTKNGSSTLTLSGSSTYSGNTNLNDGTLAINSSSGIGSSTLIIADTKTVSLGSGVSLSNAITFPTSGTGNIDVSSGTATFSGALTGSSSVLAKTGSGTLSISNANSGFGSSVNVNAGTLNLAITNAFGATTTIALANNTTLSLGSGVSIPSIVNFGTTGTVQVDSGTGTLTGNLEVGGADTMVKTGAGTLAINNDNSTPFTGATTISVGTLYLQNNNAVGTTTSITISNGATLALDPITIDNSIILAAGTETIDVSAGTATINTSIAGGSGTLVKTGAGVLSLLQTPTYAATTISAGTYALSGAATLVTTHPVTANGTLDISSAASVSIGDLSGSGFVSLGSNALTIGELSGTTFSGVIQDGGIGGGAGGQIIKLGAATLTLAGANTYTGGTTISTGTLALSGSGALSTTGTVTVTTTLDVSQVNSSTTSGDLNGGGTVSLGARGLSITELSGTTFSGVIQDGGIGGGTGGQITKLGAATLTLTGVNTYTGGTTISAGTLALTGSGALSTTGTLTDNAGFDISGITPAISTSIGPLAGTSGSATVALGAIDLTITESSSTSFAGVISGTGAVTKSDTGTLSLTNAQTYTGDTTISGGTLALSGSGALSTAGTVIITGSGDFDISGVVSTSIGPLASASTSATVTLGAADLTITESSSTSFAGVISGSGGITVDGGNTLIFTNAEAYTGATTIAATGSTNLTLSTSGDIASSASVAVNGTLDVSGVTSSTTIQNLSGSGGITLGAKTLVVSQSGDATYSGTITDGGSGIFTKAGAAALTLSSASGSFSGTTNINAGTLVFGITGALGTSGINLADSATLQISDSVTVANTVAIAAAGTGIVEVLLGNTGTISNVISGATGALNKTNSGQLNLTNGSNSYGGGTTITAGTLALVNSGILLSTGAVSIAASGTLDISGINPATSTTIGPFSGSGNATITGKELITNSSSDTEFSGTIAGSGGSLTKQGTGTLTLSGTNSYGDTTLSQGGIIGDTDSLPSNIATATSTALTFNQTVAGNYSDIISGTGSLVVQGGGVLTFTSTASVTQNSITIASGGIASVNGIMATPTNTITVLSGGELRGSGGQINQNVLNQGTVAPGNSIGQLNIIGDYTQDAGSVLDIEFSPTETDLLNVTGSVTIAGNTTLVLTASFGTYPANLNHIIVQSGTGVFGQFSTVTVSPESFVVDVSYASGDSITLLINITPFSNLNLISDVAGIARCLDNANPVDGSDLDYIIDVLRFEAIADISQTLLRMQGSVYTSYDIATQYGLMQIRNVLLEQMNDYAFKNGGKPYESRAWSEFYVANSIQEPIGNLPGYHHSMQGGVMGVDESIGEKSFIGIAGGYAGGPLDWRENYGRGRLEIGFASIYGGTGIEVYEGVDLEIESQVIGGWEKMKTRREVIFNPTQIDTFTRKVKSRSKGVSGLAHLELGSALRKRGFKFRPFGSCDYVHFRRGEVKEEGGDSVNLNISASHAGLLRAEMGLEIGQYITVGRGSWTPRVKVSEVLEKRFFTRDVHATLSVIPCGFRASGYAQDRKFFAIDGGFIGRALEDRVAIGGTVRFEKGDGYESFNWSLDARFSF